MKLRNIDPLARNGLIVFGLSMFSSAINYLSQLFMGQNLSVESFGTLNTVFSAMPILVVPATALTTFITKKVAEYQNPLEIASQISKYARYVSLFCLVLLVISVIALPIVKVSLGIVSAWVLVASVLMMLLSYYPPLFQGALNGLHKFLLLGILGLLTPLGKLFGIIIAPFFPGESFQQNIVLMGTNVGVFLTILVGYLMLRGFGMRYVSGKKTPSKQSTKLPAEYIFVVFINFGLMFIMNIDILMIRYYHGGEVAGQYSSVQLFARIAYYVTSALVTVMLPMVVTRSKNKAGPFSVFKRTLIYISIFSLCLYIPLVLFPEQITGLFFGNKFFGAASYTIFACLVAFSLSLNTTVANYMIGIGKAKILAVVFLSCCGISLVFMVLLHESVAAMLTAFCIVSLLAFVINFTYCIWHNHKMASFADPRNL